MDKLSIEIFECERGYVVREIEYGQMSSFAGRNSWTAKDVPDLEELIGTLAMEKIKARKKSE